MSSIASGSGDFNGLKYKSAKKLDLENEQNPEVAAKYAALANKGSELLIKRDNSYYLLELDDNVKLDNITKKVPRDNKSVVAVNFVDASEKQQVGSLYTTETLQSGKSLYDRGLEIIKSNVPDKEKGFRIGEGRFITKISDENGFIVDGKDDVKLDVYGQITITAEQINDYLNKEILSPNTNLDLKLSESNGNWKLALGIKTETESKLRSYINSTLLGDDNSYRRKLGEYINTEEKLNNLTEKMINGLEKKLVFSLPKEKIAAVLTGDMDAKKQLTEIVKQGFSKDYIQGILKQESGEYEKYIPDYIYEKISEYAEKYISEKVQNYVKSSFSGTEGNNTRQFLKDLYKTSGYAISDVELEKLNSTFDTSFKSNKMLVSFVFKGLVSSDKTLGKITGNEDIIKLQGNFGLTSKGHAEINNVGLEANASLNTGDINKATVVSMAEAFGNKHEKIISELVKNQRTVNVDGEASFASLSQGVYDTVVKVGEFSESNLGLSIKGINTVIEADFNDKDNIKFRSREKLTVEQAVLMSGYELQPGITVKEISLKNPAGKNALSLNNFAAAVNVNGRAEINAGSIDSGLHLDAEINKSAAKLDIKQISLSEANLNIGYNEKEELIFKAKGNKLLIDDVAFSYKNNRFSINDIKVASGEGTVNITKEGAFSGSGNGIRVNRLENPAISTTFSTRGKSYVSAHHGFINVVGPSFQGSIYVKNKKESVEFSGVAGDVTFNSAQNKITYKAAAKDSVFSLKSKERNVNIDLNLPQGAVAAFNLNDQTFEIKDKKGRSIEVSSVVKDLEGNELGKFRMHGEGNITGNLRDGGLEINSPEKGINIEGQVKVNNEDVKFSGTFHTNLKYQDDTISYKTGSKPQLISVEARDRKIVINSEGNADVNLKLFQDDIPLKLDVDNNSHGPGASTGPEVNNNNQEPFKVSVKAENTISGKTEADFETALYDKAAIGFIPNEDKTALDLALTVPGNAETNQEGIKINGFVQTDKGPLRLENIALKALSEDDTSNININSDGIELKNGRANISGKVSLNGETVALDGKAFVTGAEFNFADKNFSVRDTRFSGQVNNLKVNVSGGFDGKSREASFTGLVTSDKDAVSFRGNLKAKEFSAEKLSLSGKTAVDLRVGSAPNQYFISDIKDFSVYLNQGDNRIFSGDFSVKSARKENNLLKADSNLAFSTGVNLKKSGAGYEFELKGADIKSKDSLKTTISQMIMVMKQPHVSAQLRSKGINPEEIETLNRELNNFVVAGQLQAGTDLKINLSEKLEIKDISFSGSVKKIDMGLPIFRHTRAQGFSIGAKKNEQLTSLKNPVKLSGTINFEKNEPLKTSVEVNLNEILPKLIEKQFSHPESPLNGKVAIKMEGNKIRLYDPMKNKFFGNQISFGLKDIKIDVKDNKVNVVVDLNLLDAVYDGIKFAFSRDVKIMREINFIKENLNHLAPKDVDVKRLTLLNFNEITVDIGDILKEFGVPAELNGQTQLNNGKLVIPLKVNL